MITIENLCYTYPHGTTSALHDVSWTVGAGEFVLLAGPSGSGKSTLLRCLNGLVPHFSGGTISGRVVVNELDVLEQGPPVLSRLVGFVSQSPEAQAVLDRVEAEIAFGLENAAVPAQEMRVRVEETLELLELANLRDRKISTLSGGERQRVAIACALAFRPQILVLDEPTSQLDPQSAEEVLRALVRLNEDLGLTILLAEHRLERVLPYADRVIYLQDGRVIVDGYTRDVAAQMPQLPPLARLGKLLGWHPLPLTVKEARGFVAGTSAERLLPETAPLQSRVLPHLQANGIVPLEAENIHFSYNGVPALRGVSLRVESGEAVVLMGRNGSGKSTLLKCLVGLLSPAPGEVVVAGGNNRNRDLAGICREVAYLPQNPDDLLFAESVADELRITLDNHGLRQHANRVTELLEQLGLTSEAATYPRDLSIGQRQRVALGAVTITAPKLILLDEPTRGLDYEAKRALVDIWRGWMQAGMGLLLVTHDVEFAAMIAHRVLILSQGELIADGKASEILASTPLFAPQIARLFPGRGWLTVEDALSGLREAAQSETR
jgi:energy-coupling factor transport system ATP-binding protein